MLKTSCLFGALVSASLSLHAQGTTSWNLTGNSNATPTSILGTTTAVPLRIYTNNVSRIYIDTQGHVGIGTTYPLSTLHVEGQGFITQGLSVANGGVLANNTGRIAVIATGAVAGVYGYGNNYGVYGVSTGVGTTGYSTGGAHGVDGWSSYLGVYGNGANGYGLYGASNNVGILASGGGWAAIFLGGVLSTGGYITSDRNLKQDIEEVTNAMDIINKLQPKSYSFKSDGNFRSLHLPQGKHYGLIAQDVEQVLPSVVKQTEFELPSVTPPEKLDPGTANMQSTTTQPAVAQPAPEAAVKMQLRAVNYTELVTILIKGMQEQQQQIQQLQQQMAELKTQIQSNTGPAALSNVLSSASLSQNMPNPATSTTSISYSLPHGINNAYLVVADNRGRVIKSINLNASGTLHLDASTLSAGVYNYSLIINNNIIQTRKMTIVK